MSPLLSPAFSHAKLRLRTRVMLFFGTGQLLVFLLGAAQSFYRGSHTILLQVHANRALAGAHPHLATMFSTSAGTYITGTQGDLLYQPTSLADCLLFYTFGGVNLLQVVFIFLLTLYVYLAVRKIQPGREFSPGFRRAFGLVGLATLLMYTAQLAFGVHLAQLFEARTHQQFFLTPPSPNFLYVVFGSLLLLCTSFLELGSQLQHPADPVR